MRVVCFSPGDLRRKTVAWLRSRVTLPLVKWTVSWWLLIVFLAIFAAAALAGVAVTNRSVFCVSCHEMRVQYDRWRVSSHKNVPCEECHIMPGVGNMVRAKASALRLVYKHVKGNIDREAIEGHVSDANCKKCHAQTNDVIVYHGLKITHKKHWDMGIGCTFCHDNVVHGPNAATKNTPRMDKCFECHNGKRVSNTCGLCHETLGVRQPSAFSSEWVAGHKQEVAGNQDSCKRCHQEDFCNNCHTMATPHPSNWAESHASRPMNSQQNCKICHPSDFCADCHKQKRAHELGWMTKHVDEFRRRPDSCNQCHDRAFCSDCHARYQGHPKNWLQAHPASAKKKPENCRACHTESFCVGCHQGKVPASHQDSGWLRSHSDQASSGNSKCATCHKPAFCMRCHKTHEPKSHQGEWLKTHPTAAAASGAACATCHTKDYCSRCHGTVMPHPKGWSSAHIPAAQQNKALCARCHGEQFCLACHRGTRPSSHTATWIPKHGHAAGNGSSCANCHTRDFCRSCHSNVMPVSHKAEWRKTHGKVGSKDKTPCITCHGDKPCADCHGGIEMPHAESWVMEHKKAKGVSLTGDSVCSKCHEKAFCKTCHPG